MDEKAEAEPKIALAKYYQTVSGPEIASSLRGAAPTRILIPLIIRK